MIVKKEILCTIGPSSLNQKTIRRFEELNVTLLRINLSHTSIVDLPKVVEKIRSFTDLPICFDSEGAQVRTGKIAEGSMVLTENSELEITLERVPGNLKSINFYPPNIIKELKLGDFVSIDFNSVLCRVTSIKPSHIGLKVLSGGKVGSNKAVTVEREIRMNPFTEKDLKAFELAKELGIKHVALSFVNHASDVLKLREILGPGIEIISKIECRNALNDLEAIVKESDAILIDRGDMSRQVNIERIPKLQKEIIKMAHQDKTGKVYVATNLLESMVTENEPTRAEVNDIYNTLSDGADGLVLAAETAIGKYPDRAVEMVVKMIHEFEKSESRIEIFENKFDSYFSNPLSLLNAPHGGKLINSFATVDERKSVDSLRQIEIDESLRLDCEQMCLGTYSPLDGFIGEDDFHSVLDHNKLVSGVKWTVPIIFQLDQKRWDDLKAGEVLLLSSEGSKDKYIFEVTQKYKVDLEVSSQKWFSTSDASHPGAHSFITKGQFLLAGSVKRVEDKSTSFDPFCYTPAQLRYIFNQKGWSRVVAFHTRNVPHRAHEYLQNSALESSLADGLFLNPVIGPKKSGDFLPEPILKAYQMLIEFGYYPKDKVILSAFNYYPRYCGPREAIFTALCRKNMGCSHFIIGRDHAGVGDYYKGSNQAYFDKVGDIGIEPVFFDEIAYNTKISDYEPVKENQDYLRISGTQVRTALQNGKDVPDWFMRELIVEYLQGEVAKGNPIFS